MYITPQTCSGLCPPRGGSSQTFFYFFDLAVKIVFWLYTFTELGQTTSRLNLSNKHEERTIMKMNGWSVTAAFLLSACALENGGGSGEITWKMIEDRIAPGVEISAERPFPDILSEKEVLSRTAVVFQKRGMFKSNYYIYGYEPRLLTAKVEKPFLMYGFNYNPGSVYYTLTANTDNGQVLFRQMVYAIADVPDEKFLGIQNDMEGQWDSMSYHYITEREAVELIASQFPGEPFEGPIMTHIKLEDNIHSTSRHFWYFTVDNEDYIIDARIGAPNGYNSIPGGVTNHQAISKAGGGGSFYLQGERMARLVPRGNFFAILRENSAATVNGHFNNPAPAAFDYVPLPLK
jgi:hypothetical protein